MENFTEDQIIAKALDILASRTAPGTELTAPQQVATYLKVRLAEQQSESFYTLYLSSRHTVITLEESFKGTIDGAAVYPREIAKAALINNAAAVIFAHNHPSGFSDPSAADRRITQRLVEALALIDVRVLDHIVVGGTDHYSFAEHGLL
jgi:DNA repair protein RadC